jgi:hypothetical protein
MDGRLRAWIGFCVMETPLHWIHTAPPGIRIAFLQGFFESAGEVDAQTMSMRATVLPELVQDILQLLGGLDIEAVIVGTEPPVIAVDVNRAARIPLLNPVIKDGKYYEMSSIVRDLRTNTRR